MNVSIWYLAEDTLKVEVDFKQSDPELGKISSRKNLPALDCVTSGSA